MAKGSTSKVARRQMAIFFMKRYDGNSSRAAQELRLILEEHCPTHAKRYCQKWYQRHMNQMPIETDIAARAAAFLEQMLHTTLIFVESVQENNSTKE
jgi:hypothetical protein